MNPNFGNQDDSLKRYVQLANLQNLSKNNQPSLPQDLSGASVQTSVIPKKPMAPPPGSAQSFDVRANQVITPEEPNILKKIGKSIGELAQMIGQARTPEQDDEPMPMQNSAPPEMPPMNSETIGQSQPPIVPQELGVPNIQEGNPQSISLPNQETSRAGFFDNPLSLGLLPALYSKLTGSNTEQPQVSTQPVIQDPVEVQKRSQQLSQSGEVGTVPGATSQVLSNPTLKGEIEKIFGVSITPEMQQQIEAFENAATSYSTSLDNLSQLYKDKIEKRDFSKQDKIMFGLALAAPLILGLTMGKESGIGALGGALTGVGDVLSKRSQEPLEAMKRIAEIEKEKLETGVKSAELIKKAKEANPNKKMQDIYLKDGKLIDGKLVLDTGNPLLPLKATATKDEKDIQKFKEKEMPKLEEEVSKVERAVEIIDNMDALLALNLKDNQTGVGGLLRNIPFYDTVTKAVKSVVPVTRDTFKDENGNIVKFSEIYNNYYESLMDSYRQFFGGTAAKHFGEHFSRKMPNPYEMGSFLSGQSDLGQAKSVLKEVKKEFENHMITTLETKGVDTTPIKQLFSQSQSSQTQKKNQDTKQRAEQAKEALKDPNKKAAALSGQMVR